ncbi:hypothetical protein HYX12_02250 [Candidatus Woesearchaeota archaeon]|nr:hypothetical protein [Candidatus Woesearchaeota archaeon]
MAESGRMSKEDFDGLVRTSEEYYGKGNGYHYEEVPLSKILVLPIDGDVPRSHSESELILLEKHKDGFYTVIDGRHRLYHHFRQNSYKFTGGSDPKSRIVCASKIYVFCMVRDVISDKRAGGVYVWQHNFDTRTFNTSFLKRIWRGITGYSRFRLIEGKVRRNLSITTQVILGKVEDSIGTLYSDGKTRLHDLKLIANIDEYAQPGRRDALMKNQVKRLRNYKKQLQKLAMKDDSKAKEAEGWLIQLSAALEKELQRGKINRNYKKEVAALKADIDKLIRSYEGQIALLKNPDSLENSAEIEKLIEDEQSALDNITVYTLRDKDHWGPAY